MFEPGKRGPSIPWDMMDVIFKAVTLFLYYMIDLEGYKATQGVQIVSLWIYSICQYTYNAVIHICRTLLIAPPGPSLLRQTSDPQGIDQVLNQFMYSTVCSLAGYFWYMNMQLVWSLGTMGWNLTWRKKIGRPSLLVMIAMGTSRLLGVLRWKLAMLYICIGGVCGSKGIKVNRGAPLDNSCHHGWSKICKTSHPNGSSV